MFAAALAMAIPAHALAVMLIEHRPIQFVLVAGYLGGLAWSGAAYRLWASRTGAMGFEIVGTTLWLILAAELAVGAASYQSPGSWIHRLTDPTHWGAADRRATADAALFVVKAVAVLVMSAVTAAASWKDRAGNRKVTGAPTYEDEEDEPLLGVSSINNGGTKAAEPATPAVPQRSGSTFSGFGRKLALMWPCLWPQQHPMLQLRVLFCVGILLAIRLINLLVPLSYKSIVDTLTPTEHGNTSFP